jgi:hypothetical protein
MGQTLSLAHYVSQHRFLNVNAIGIRLNMKLDLQSLFGLLCAAVHWLRPRIWDHIQGRYWSAKIEDISL